MATYQMTGPTTLTVTFTREEAAIMARAQRDGLAQFTGAVDTVLSQFRDKYDAEDKSRLVNLFGAASLDKKTAVFGLLEG